MNKKTSKHIQKILYSYPYELNRLVVLLGFKSLLDSTSKKTFKEIVEKYHIHNLHFSRILHDLSYDDSIETILEGELRTIYDDLKAQMISYKEEGTIFSGDDIRRLLLEDYDSDADELGFDWDDLDTT